MDLTAVISMAIMGVLFAAGLALAHQKLKLEEDDRIEQVDELLPGADCGACGYAGCEAMARALVDGEVVPQKCPVADDATYQKIADLLNLSSDSSSSDLVARVLCRGGKEEAKQLAAYRGINTCAAANLVNTGGKACTYGCLGLADCVAACKFDALEMNDNGLPVVNDDNCTGCNACVIACPRDIIELHEREQKLFVWCLSEDDPATSRKSCTVACIGCGICAKLCDGVEMKEPNLAVVSETNAPDCDQGVEKCPTDAIDYK